MDKRLRFKRRAERTRTHIRLVSDRNRLSIFKSGRHIYAQIIDDSVSQTLVSASTLEKDVRKIGKSNCNKQAAAMIGKLIAERAAKKAIKEVVFDKGGYKYHGVVKAFADEARKELSF